MLFSVEGLSLQLTAIKKKRILFRIPVVQESDQQWPMFYYFSRDIMFFLNVLRGKWHLVVICCFFLAQTSGVSVEARGHAQWYAMMNIGWRKQPTAPPAPKTRGVRPVS